ncbi:MAG TPA: nucleoside transporter C-terminal domain-containing protein [Bryobacteraceae bacterium]|jgi:CNT family concentrative nucleoside transporter|nr:nucleoside transporter C-terminal domain-containing protein [Bryobacteraceae bacterium]
MGRFTGLLGLVAILAVAWLLSRAKRAIKFKIVLWGLGLQFGFAVIILKTDVGKIFQAASVAVTAMLNYAEVGSAFVFGDTLGRSSGSLGSVFAFQVLPIIIFIASFFSILYYLGIMQWIVKAFAVVMQKVMGASGAESLNVAASIFMGQTEAPLTIRPFIPGLTESELFTIMVSGMAHVSGAVMAAYVKMAHVEIQHLLTAVIMTAPATIMLAKIFQPEVGTPATAGKVDVKIENTSVNIIDAAAQGAGDGLQLCLNIGAMLIAFLALIALIDGAFAWAHGMVSWIPVSMEQLFGMIFAPVAWLLGVSWNDCATIGRLLGERLVTNEFIAFIDLGKLKNQLDPHSFRIATYALCGFANFSSIAIQVGGIGALAPSRKSDLARLGLRAVAAGTMANFMSACIAGILL